MIKTTSGTLTGDGKEMKKGQTCRHMYRKSGVHVRDALGWRVPTTAGSPELQPIFEVQHKLGVGLASPFRRSPSVSCLRL